MASPFFQQRRQWLGHMIAFPLLFMPGILVAADNALDNTSPVYAKAINSVAVLVMQYYADGFTTPNSQNRFSGQTHFQQYKERYPAYWHSLTFTHAKLTRTAAGLAFVITATLAFQDNQKRHQLEINDTFFFDGLLPEQIASVTTQQRHASTALSAENNVAYYLQREWAYAWTALLNGVAAAEQWLEYAAWQSQAMYSTQNDDKKITVPFAQMDSLQHAAMGDGGYLLRDLNAPQKRDADHYQVALQFDFYGEKDHLPVLARSEQKVTYRQKSDGSRIILNVNERYLLPDPQPWQKILC